RLAPRPAVERRPGRLPRAARRIHAPRGPMTGRPLDAEVVVAGAGAAGMMAALAARGAIDRGGEPSAPRPGAPRVLLVDGSQRLGLKILVSGGGRCNVTNERVTDADFDTDSPHVVRGLLLSFPPTAIVTFLAARGVPLYAEPLGKLFPESDRAED